MRRDFLFLAMNLPPKHLVRDRHHFTATLDNITREYLLKSTQRVHGLQGFLLESAESPLFGIGVRNEHADEPLATRKAWQTLSGIVDGYALFLDAAPPKICPYFILREGNSADASLRSYAHEGTWLTMHPKEALSERRWEEVKYQHSQRLLKLFDIAAAEAAQLKPPLFHQILYSVRMFRHGAAAEVFGIQFLCKFSALEGLVCGSETSNKKQLLRDRLGPLFRKVPALNRSQIDTLWELRCTASHQAKAFEFEDDPDLVNHAIHIESLDRFFRGVLVFALDHFDKVTTVNELWRNLGSYELPDYAVEERPRDMPRYAASHFLINPHSDLPGLGSSFDVIYEPPSAQKSSGVSGAQGNQPSGGARGMVVATNPASEADQKAPTA
jgi:hypothetical protein